MADPLDVTVVVPVRNEERNLPGCLERLGRFAAVVVVDSGSTDGTRRIAQEHGATLLDFEWDGRFPKKRNWTLRNHPFATPWVLFLDADEYVDGDFTDELERVLPGTQHVGFWLNYDNWFLGKKLHHGERNRKLALFRVGAGEYEKIDEEGWSRLDMEVHEHPVLSGSTGEIFSRIAHHDYRGYAHWRAKHDEYSSWEARRLHRLRQQGALNAAELTPRQRRKYAALGKWWLPPAYFFATYVGKRGYKDGFAGLAFALSKAQYFWRIGVKAARLDRVSKSKLR